MRKLPLPFGTTISAYVLNNPQTLVNLYPLPAPPGSKNKYYLKSREGLRQIISFDEDILGLRWIDSGLYVVTKSKVYKVNTSNWTRGIIGDVEFSTNRRVYIEYDGQHIIFVGGKVYGYDGDSLTELRFTTGDALPVATTVAFLNYRFVINEENSGKFYWSNLFSLEFDPLNYATAEGKPDNLLGVISDGKKLYLFGAATLEVWYDTGSGFARIPGAFGPPGTVDFKTVQLLNDYVFYVGSDGVVYVASGMRREKISNEYVERRLHEENYRDLVGNAFALGGNHFYCLHLNGKETLCYHLESKAWHIRQSPNKNVWGVKAVTQLGNRVLGAGWNGEVFELDNNYYRDGEENFIKQLRTVTLTNSQEYFTLSGLEMEVNQGRTDDCKMYLRYSEDGVNWSKVREGIVKGFAGQRHRVNWWKLGRHRNMILDFYTYAPKEFIIYNLWGYVYG